MSPAESASERINIESKLIGRAWAIGSPPPAREVVDIFDALAPQLYQERHGPKDSLDVVGYPALWELLNNTLPHHAVVMDLACGTGGLTHEMLKRYQDPNQIGLILNVDISGRMLAIAQKTQIDPRVVTMLSFAHRMTRVGDNFVDLILSVYGLDYMNIPRTLKEVNRVLVPGGRFIALVPHPDRNCEYWQNGGNEGNCPNGWVMELWPNSTIPVKKQYLNELTWRELFRRSPLKLNSVVVPKYSHQQNVNGINGLHDKWDRTPQRMLIFDAMKMA